MKITREDYRKHCWWLFDIINNTFFKGDLKLNKLILGNHSSYYGQSNKLIYVNLCGDSIAHFAHEFAHLIQTQVHKRYDIKSMHDDFFEQLEQEAIELFACITQQYGKTKKEVQNK